MLVERDTNARLPDPVLEATGGYTTSDPFVSLLYELMRDHLPVGTVEQIIRHVVDERGPIKFCNKWLAEYAAFLAYRIRAKEIDHGRPTVADTTA